jgi:hypothetical protein
VGRNASDYIVRVIAAGAPPSIKARLAHMHEYPGAIASFEDAAPEEVTILCAAAERALERLKSEGPVGWSDPSFFPGFLSCFEELVDYLHMDPRSSGGQAADLKPSPGRKFRVVGFQVDEPAAPDAEPPRRRLFGIFTRE